jgi:DNA-binding NarL/FixJ family response regulator
VSSPTPSSKSILFIDGHDTDRHYYAERLRLTCPDFLVIEVASGSEALKIYKDRRIDCVVLELGLPDGSGFEVLSKLVPVARAPEIPVVVLTQLSHESLLQVARRNGAQIVLQKAFVSGDMLEQAVLKALAGVQRDWKKN